MRLAATVAVVIGLALAEGSSPGSAAAAPTSVATPGKGILTICRSWILYRSCKSYDKVALPPQISVGDRITLNFSSNTKAYVFLVAEIRPKGDGCLVLSDRSGGSEDGERLEVPSCSPIAGLSSDQK
jgi:hypothetical protein